MFKILALDQSTKSTGYCVIQNNKVKDYGLITADSNLPILERIRVMYFNIQDLIDKTKPDFVVFEGTQYQNNAGAFGGLSKLQGTILAILYDRDLSFYIVEPTCWKSFCKIKGRKRVEQKANTKIFVAEKYNVDVSEDEADAIGIATWAIGNIIKK